MGGGGRAPPFLTSALNGGDQLHASATQPPGEKIPGYPFDRPLGKPLSRSRRSGEEKNVLSGFEPRLIIPADRRNYAVRNKSVPTIHKTLRPYYKGQGLMSNKDILSEK
jgi:hypothetical protein